MKRVKMLVATLSLLVLVGCINNSEEETNVIEERPVVVIEQDSIPPLIENESQINSTDNNLSNLNKEPVSWWYVPNSEHKLPSINRDLTYKIEDYGAMYSGNVSKKVLYLTMDEGYENGYTNRILDVLKENDVKATFFVTAPYLDNNNELVKRMVNEGHMVANHSDTHPSMPTIVDDKLKFESELIAVEKKFKDITGKDMPKYFRPPMGKYSEQSLKYTQAMGYKTVFWSFAYKDWETENQPEHEYAKNKILGGLHNGGIILLHAVSKTNTEILGDVIKEAKNQGYTFELLP